MLEVRLSSALFVCVFGGAAALACGDGPNEPATSHTEELQGCLDNCGPPTESFFANDKVATVRITFDTEYMKTAGYAPEQWEDLLWNTWNSHCGPYEWVPVKVEYESPDGVGDDTLERVGMRLRGGKSRGKNPLAGFKLDYDKLVKAEASNRRFADLNRLEALSNENDNSNMLQCMSYQLVRDFGIEAPRCNHIRVYINGELYGLMENAERAKDKRFLRHHFGTNKGSLYGGSASCGYADSLADLEYRGDAFNDDYAAAYEILSGSSDDAEASLLPMLKCGDNEETPNDEDFKACISDWIDVDNWLRLIAAESLMPSVEDFVGARRNYYIYLKPSLDAPHGGRFHVWGWDYDTGIETATCFPRTCDPFSAVAGWYGPRGARAKLVDRLTTVFRDRYCELSNEFLTEVYDPQKVDEMAAVIEPFMTDDPVVSHQAWQEEVAKMREFIGRHRTDVRAVIDAECR